MNTISNNMATEAAHKTVVLIPEIYFDIIKEDDQFSEMVAREKYSVCHTIVEIAERKLSGYDLETLKGFLKISHILAGSPTDIKGEIDVGFSVYLDDYSVSTVGYKDLVSTLVDKLKTDDMEVGGRDDSALYDIVVEGDIVFVVMKEGFGDIWASNSYTRFYRDVLRAIMERFGLKAAMRSVFSRKYIADRLKQAA